MFSATELAFRIILILAFVSTTSVPIASHGDAAEDIRESTRKSHAAARAMATSILNKRLTESMTRLVAAYVQQDHNINLLVTGTSGTQLALQELETAVNKFGLDSNYAKEALSKAVRARLDEYVVLYDKTLALAAKAQAVRYEAIQSDQKLEAFAQTMKSVCTVGEGAATDNFPLPNLNTPSPDLTVKVNVTFGPNGTSIDPNASSSGGKTSANDAYMYSVVGGALAGQVFGTTLASQVAIASATTAGIAIAIALVSYSIAMQQAISEAAGISDALIHDFYNRATSADVARYYKDACQDLIVEFDEYLAVSKELKANPLNTGPVEQIISKSREKYENFKKIYDRLNEIQIKIAKEVGFDSTKALAEQPPELQQKFKKALSDSKEYREAFDSLQRVSSRDLAIMVKATMLQLQLKNSEIDHLLRGIGLRVIQKLKTEGFSKLASLVYQSYNEGFAVRYPNAIRIVGHNIAIGEKLSELKIVVDDTVSGAIKDIIRGRSTAMAAENILKVELEIFKIRSMTKNPDLKKELDLMANSLKQLRKALT
ncbi:MAG: hypothetical protein IT289_07730 [Oligoflexia bacterium]|nr:hypothetical protein [Oligoflexia bacterium]